MNDTENKDEGQKTWKENERDKKKRVLKITYCIPEKKH